MLLVTGATGYIGAALVAELTRRGADVRALARDPARASVLPPTVDVVRGDIADEESLRAAMRGCDGVFHVAGAVSQDPVATREANAGGTARVLRAAADAGVRRVVHTSTTAAIVAADGLISEDAPNATALTDAYALSKVAAERVVLDAVAAGQDVVITNPGSVYGPSPRGPRSYNTLLAATAGGEIDTIVDATVGWVLAEDVAIGHVLAFEHGVSGARHVLGGEAASYSRMLHTYAELVGSPHRVRALPPGSELPADAPLFAQRSQHYGMLGPARLDARNALATGFAPRGVDDGLRITVDWLRSLGVG